jgi:hypothetical protein
MLIAASASGQTSFGLNGIYGISGESFTSLNSYEYNISNYSVIKDWAFSFTYGAEFASSVTSNLYQITAAKTFGSHFVSLRYTPGYQKEFIFKSGEAIPYNNTAPITLESRFLYKELFGAGYSYRINNEFSAGLNVRYFKEDFTNENVTAIFSDTIYFVRETEEDNSELWKTDIGVVWKPFDNLVINLGSINLFTLGSEITNEDNSDFEIKTEKSLFAGINFSSSNNFNLLLNLETNNSFLGGLSYLFDLIKSKLGFAASVFHDNEQEPFIAGFIPAVIFTSKYFDLSLTVVKYLSERNTTGSYEDFKSDGISNIINNRYSYDKLLLTTNFKLNTLLEQRVKFLGVEIKQNIYPALNDKYIDEPVATAKVVNLTNERIDVKPYMIISGISEDKLQSPIVSIPPYDTSEVNYYAVISENYSGVNPEITYANFYLMTVNDDFDDEYQKAMLVNGINAWDGNVKNLRYFIQRDMDFSVKYSKTILAKYKTKIDTVANALSVFYKAKIIFNSFIKNLTYTSDPRASSEYVQYPNQTLELKGGDCDDLSVCYSSLLESIGIETALVDYKTNASLRHVNLMFNTKLSPNQASLISENDTKYFIRKNESGDDEVWIPIETTSLSDFEKAWVVASDKFQTEAINNFGLVKGEVQIIEVY